MKIIALEAENIKKLTAIRIEPDGNVVQITGKNGMGKSSVLDAIWWALEGADHIQKEPIRKGADTARIELDLGELIVKRTFRRKDGGKFTTAITVENGEGARYPRPQTMIDELIGALTFDPLKFSRQPAKAQVETLKGFVSDFDFEAADSANKTDYDERTVVNRRVESLRNQIEALPEPKEGDAEPIDVQRLIDELAEAGEHNAAVDREAAERATWRKEMGDWRAQADSKKIEIEALEKRLETLRSEVNRLLKAAKASENDLAKAEPLPEHIDVTNLRAAIEAGQARNAELGELAVQGEKRATLTAELEEAKAESERLTTAITRRNEQKREAVAAAKLPIQGIEFGEGELLLNGVPFEQASDAEQLRVSVAIAMAMNPKLRVIRVRDGSLLDEDSMRLLGEIADEHDFQVWVERVDSSGKVGFVLEDGHIKGQQLAAEAAE